MSATPSLMTLGSLSPEGLTREVDRSQYPKWGTLCLLRLAGLPTLDALLVLPNARRQSARHAMRDFAARLHNPRLLVRSDGGIEAAKYYRGGHSLDISEAWKTADRLLNDGRAVIFMEPTNRFTNRLSINLMAAQDAFVVEMLGPGFDVSDLNRGGINPQVSIIAAGVDWREYEQVSRSNLRTQLDFAPSAEAHRLRRRLEIIGAECLPVLGNRSGPEPERAAAAWLRERGYTMLWDHWRPTVSLTMVRRWHEAMFMLGRMHSNQCWKALSCSASDLGDGRFVYWDVVDGSRKFAMR